MRILFRIWLFALLLSLCNCRQQPAATHDDLQQICDSGRLKVLTLYRPVSYFLYRGQEMGIQFDMANQFAQHLGVKLDIEVCATPQELTDRIRNGEGDLGAFSIPYNFHLEDSLIFCGVRQITQLVIVQRTGTGRKGQRPLTDVTQLIGKDVYVKPGIFLQRLNNLNQELGGGIRIHVEENDSLSLEDLITAVSQKKIDYVVAEEGVARLHRNYFNNLDIRLKISCDVQSSWIVRYDHPALAKAATEWFLQEERSLDHKAKVMKYFELSKNVPRPPILSLREGKISHYDHLFRKYAKEIGWDWRLLASLSYQESQFDTLATSWSGAIGIMQMMPRTMHMMGVKGGMEWNPEENIRVACKYLQLLDSIFRRVPEDDRHHFILAAYNSGVGHITDAMALANKYGRNKYIWQNHVDNYLLLKSSEHYFNDPVCKYGYFQGSTTCDFVYNIMHRFELYKERIKP